MAPYSVWAKTRKTPRVAWVCGPEPVLRYDVADTYRAVFPRLPVRSIPGDSSSWDALLTVPSFPLLTFVWGAEKLTVRDRICHLLGDEFENAFTVFVSAENDFPAREPDGWLAALRDSRHGLLVRCAVPRDPEAQAQLVASWWPGAGRNLGAEVLARCGGDIAAARAAVKKAVCAGLLPNSDAVRLVCLPGAPGDFADCLVACDVKKAMAAVAFIDPEEAGAALALLSSRLSVLALLGDAARKGENVLEFARRQKIDPYLVRLLRPHAAAYTPDKVSRCRRLLALAESSWRRGARDGVLESVAALWLPG